MLSADDLKILGERLLALRQAAGLTAVAVARDALGYQNGSHVALTRLERAVLANPRQDHLRALAQFYAVASSHLFAEPAPGANERCPGSSEGSEESQPEGQSGDFSAGMPSGMPGDLPPDLAGRIRYLRKGSGLEQEEFAMSLRPHGALITSSNIQAWETGAQVPNPLQLRALSRFSQRSEEWLMLGESASNSPTPQAPARWLFG